MRKQRGVSLSGLLMISALVIAALLFGFKVGPSYMEYYTIRKNLKAIAEDPQYKAGTPKDIRTAYALRGAVDNMKSVGPSDLEISKEGETLVISASYSVKVHLFGNMSVVMDFEPTSQ